jgi:hypothetical protein
MLIDKTVTEQSIVDGGDERAAKRGSIIVNGRAYPKSYRPGVGSVEIDNVWRILDQVPPDAWIMHYRVLLAGMFTSQLLMSSGKTPLDLLVDIGRIPKGDTNVH